MKERLALIGVTAAVMAPAVPMAQAEAPNQGPEGQDQIENPYLAKMAGSTATAPVCKTETSTYSADGSGEQNGKLETTTCYDTTMSFAGSEVQDSDFANGKVKVLANIGKPLSKKQIRKYEKNGACFMVGEGTKYPKFLNQGWNVNDKKEFGVDTRRSKVCRINGRLIRVLCDNEVKLKKVPKQPKTIFVSNFGKANISVNTVATANTKAYADCGTSSAYGEGSASAKASAKASLKMAVRTKGQSLAKTKESVRLSGTATVSAKAEAKAIAAAMCVKETTTTTTTTPPQEEKTNLPPTVNLIGPKHVLTDGVVEICAYGSDPENDIRSRTFSETGNGEFISFVYDGDEQGEFCIKYKAGTTADHNTVTAKVIDGAANSASDTEEFDTVAPAPGDPGSFDPKVQTVQL